MTVETAADHWDCAVCGRATVEVARVYCTNCQGYHDVCLDCAPDVEIEGQMRKVRDLSALRGDGQGGSRLAILNVGGQGRLCDAPPSQPR